MKLHYYLVSIIILLLFSILYFVERHDSLNIDTNCSYNNYSCFEHTVINAMNNDGEKEALRVLHSLYRNNKLSSDYCHIITHQIGWKSSENNKQIKTSPLSSICRWGYYHGFFTNVVKMINSSNLVQLCSLKNTLAQLQCFHGMGHGLSVVNDYDIKTALQMCSLITEENEKEACATGVFMEKFKPGHFDVPSEILNPFTFCQLHDFKQSCYFYIGILLLEKHNNSFSTALQDCDALEINFKDDCKRGLGVFAARVSDYAPEKVYQICTTNRACSFGAAFEYGQSAELLKGMRFCMKLPFSLSINCFSEMLTIFSKSI